VLDQQHHQRAGGVVHPVGRDLPQLDFDDLPAACHHRPDRRGVLHTRGGSRREGLDDDDLRHEQHN